MAPVVNSLSRSTADGRRGVVGSDDEAHGHLVVRVEVGVVVAADRQCHEGPAGQRAGDLEAGGVDDPLGGGGRDQVLDAPLGGPADLDGKSDRAAVDLPGPLVGRAVGIRRGLVGMVPHVISAVQHRQGYRCPVAYWIMKAIISPFLFLLWRVRVEGLENVPADGPVILAANHQSFCDSFFLPLVVRRRVTYVAKAEYFDCWKTAWFFRAAGQIPMNRSGGDASQRALDTATGVWQGGCAGHLPRGHPGAGHPSPQGQDRGGPAQRRLWGAGGAGRAGGHPHRPTPRIDGHATLPQCHRAVRRPRHLRVPRRTGDQRGRPVRAGGPGPGPATRATRRSSGR